MGFRWQTVIFGSWLLAHLVCISAYGADQGEAAQKASDALQARSVWSRESYQRSHDLYVEASKLSASDGSAAAGFLRQASRLSLILGDYVNARAELSEALRLDEEAGQLNGRVKSVSLLLLVTLRSGASAESESLYKQLLELNGQTIDASARAHSALSCGEFNSFQGTAKKTIEFFSESLRFAGEAAEEDLISQSSLKLGYAHIRVGDPQIAQGHISRALQNWSVRGDHRGMALAYFGLGFAKSTMDEKQAALDAYSNAEALFPDRFEDIEKGKLFNGIATIYEQYGQNERALDYRERALESYRLADYPSGRLATLPSVANLYYLKGDKTGAIRLFDESRKMAKELKEEFYLGIIEECLGDIELNEGRFAAAVNSFNGAIKVYQKLGIQLPRVQDRLGLALENAGDLTEARKQYDFALASNTRTKDFVPASGNLYNLARLSRTEGKVDEAIDLIGRSLSLTEALRSDVFHSGLQKSFLERLADRYYLQVNLLTTKFRQTGERSFSDQALQTVERFRARSLLENLALTEAKFFADASPEIVQQEKDTRALLNARSDRLTELLSRDERSDEVDKTGKEIDELKDRLEKIKIGLKQKSPVYSAVKDPPLFDVQQFQKEILDDDSVFLEFSLGEQESYLWLIGKSEITHYTLPSRLSLEAQVTNLLALLQAREQNPADTVESYNDRVSLAEQRYSAAAAELSRDLFGRAAEKLINKKLMVSPDGRLGYLPLGALPFPNSESGEPMVTTNDIVYAPSASILLLLKTADNASRAKPSKDLIVFADPVFSNSDERLGTGGEDQNIFQGSFALMRSAASIKALGRLPASQAEAISVSGIIRNSTVVSGFSANRERVLSADLGDYKVVHFATHGIFDEMHPDLSGILLSLYDAKGNPSEGFIRAQDIYGLDLNADLVVLSACNTGVGKEVRGEGIVSLNAAFLQSGARSVVSTLWKVDDHATEKLMREFYSALAVGDLTPGQALRHAQLNMTQDVRYRSPYYWAAFTLHGDNSVRIAFSSGRWAQIASILVIVAVPLLVFGIWRYRRTIYSRVKT